MRPLDFVANMEILHRWKWACGLFLLSQLTVNVFAADADPIPVKTIGTDVHGLPVEMPLLGAGTWQYNSSTAYESLCLAFGAGITFVDTAFNYHNEEGVGKAIRECYRGRRQDLFVMTKVPGGLSREETLAAHHQNMFELNLDYVDHVMLHFPADWDQTNASPQARQESWLALEEVYYAGKARSIGVSHYCPSHIDDIMQVATVTPAVNQVEYHVGSGDVDHVMEKCKQLNITFMSFSPLCGPCATDAEHSLINGKLVGSIARNYKNVTGSQVALRFIVQQALQPGSVMGAVIPKSNNKDHIESNFGIFSFELSSRDMKQLFGAMQPAAGAGDCKVP